MAIIKITKEQYLGLLPIERQLKSALYSNYARISAAEFEGFCGLYKAIYGTELTRGEKNCSTCRLKALKKVAVDYFYFKDTYFKRWGRNPEEPKPEKENNLDSNLIEDGKA